MFTCVSYALQILIITSGADARGDPEGPSHMYLYDPDSGRTPPPPLERKGEGEHSVAYLPIR